MQVVEWLYHTLNLKANPFSGTLVLGWALTMIGYWARKLPEYLLNLFMRTFSRELVFDDYSHWNISLRLYKNFMRLAQETTLTNRWATRFTINYLEKEGRLTPTVGRQPFVYQGKFGWFSVVEHRPENLSDSTSGTRHQVSVRLFTRSRAVLESLAATLNEKPIEDSYRSIYTAGEGTLAGAMSFVQYNPSNGLDSVIMSDVVKTQLIERLTFFKNNRQWYVERGIPYKLCILLYGPPGTGKTSLAKAISQHMDKDVFVASPITERTFALGMRSSAMEEGHLVMVLEEIDSVFSQDVFVGDSGSGDNVKKRQSPISRTTLLGVLDGCMTPDGMVVIMTTNHPDKLDPALVRPGRVDISLHIEAFDAAQAMQMARRMYGNEELFRITQFPKGLTGAQIQNAFLCNPENPSAFIDDLWKLEAAREAQLAMKSIMSS